MSSVQQPMPAAQMALPSESGVTTEQPRVQEPMSMRGGGEGEAICCGCCAACCACEAFACFECCEGLCGDDN